MTRAALLLWWLVLWTPAGPRILSAHATRAACEATWDYQAGGASCVSLFGPSA